MKYLKRFLERIEESDLDDILDILQYVGETTPKIWVNEFVRFSDGILVVYFDDYDSKPDIEEIKHCRSRLESIGYRLISYDVNSMSGGLWFLVMTKELESKYKNDLHFWFIEDLGLKKDKVYNFSEVTIYFNGDEIYVQRGEDWTIWDSITGDQEHEDENKVIANISLLKTQHKMRGIQQAISRRF